MARIVCAYCSRRHLCAGACLGRFCRAGAARKMPPSTISRAKYSMPAWRRQTFAGGLRHCSELNGTNFYFQPRDRVLNLDEYHRSLDNLALQHVFNPETHKPWNQQDADTRWAEVQKEAVQDRANCALVASLPDPAEETPSAATASGLVATPAEQEVARTRPGPCRRQRHRSACALRASGMSRIGGHSGPPVLRTSIRLLRRSRIRGVQHGLD